jgi:hypothetical protein
MPEVYRSTVIDASVNEVWQTIRNFHDVSWARAVLTKCSPVGSRGGEEIGAQRVLNGAFQETLLDRDDPTWTLRYRLDNGPPPVSASEVRDFISVVRVRPVTDRDVAFVEWSASWEAADDAACEFAGDIYRALLAALKKTLSPGTV